MGYALKKILLSTVLAFIPFFQLAILVYYQVSWIYYIQIGIFTSMFVTIIYGIWKEHGYALPMIRMTLMACVLSDLIILGLGLIDRRIVAFDIVYCTLLAIYAFKTELRGTQKESGYQIWPIIGIIFGILQSIFGLIYSIYGLKNIINNRNLKGIEICIMGVVFSAIISFITLTTIVVLAFFIPPQTEQLCKNFCEKSDFTMEFNILTEKYACNCESGGSMDFDFSEDNELKEYLTAIKYDDPELKKLASEITSYCYSGIKECQLVLTYMFVANLDYTGDARDAEHIQSPFDTLNIQSGDCEDLTILLTSLLENIGIETYILHQKSEEINHLYAVACGVDPDSVRNFTLEYHTSLEQVDYSKGKFELAEYDTKYLAVKPNDQNNTRILNYSFRSTKNIDFFVVPLEDELTEFLETEEFMNYPDCSKKGMLEISGSCQISEQGGFIIYNNNMEPVEVDYEIAVNEYLTINESLIQISTYDIAGQECIVIDPTFGEYSYPGLEGNTTGKIIAFDPIRHDKHVLRAS